MAAAFANCSGIGIENRLPWSIPGDWEYFEKVTTKPYGDQLLTTSGDLTEWNNIVIMGRKSYEAFPMCKIPLANRHNIIVSRNKSYKVHKDATLALTLEEAFSIAATLAKENTRVFLLGGQSVYEEGINSPRCSHILLTSVYNNSSKPIICDTFFPNIDRNVYRLALHSELEAFLQEQNIPKGKQTFKNFEYEFLLYIRI